jgi:hypothetical protein
MAYPRDPAISGPMFRILDLVCRLSRVERTSAKDGGELAIG